MAFTSIDEVILAALNTMFTLEMITNVAGDPMALHTLKQDPLQDDPTLTAPYLIYSPDVEKGIKLDDRFEQEIGGPVHYKHCYRAKCGTPRATDRVTARQYIETLTQRAMWSLIRHFDLSDVNGGPITSSDGGKRIEAAYKLEVEVATSRIYGGETEWYGEGHINWWYPVAWYVPIVSANFGL